MVRGGEGGGSGRGGSGKMKKVESEFCSGQHVWEGREILPWVMRKLRQRHQITPYDINYPTLWGFFWVFFACHSSMSVLYPSWKDIYNIPHIWCSI